MKKFIIFTCILVFGIILLMGLARGDACIETDQHGMFCKSDVPILLPDFPDELFIKYWSGAYSVGCMATKIPNIMLCGFFDKNENLVAIAWMEFINQYEGYVWCFVEINGKANIVWFTDETSQKKRELVRQETEQFNQKQQR